MSRPTVMLLGMDDAQQADLRLALKDVANVVRSKTPAEQIADEYRSVNPGAAIVSVRSDTPARFGLIHNIAAAGGIVIVVSESKDPELILRSMRSGAREFVLESDHEELRLAVRTHAKVTFGTGEIGQVVTIFGAKGGVGATAIATNLAGAMQRRSLRVCLVDLDLYLGDVLAFLDIPGSYSITDVLANMSRLDRDLLATSVTKHRSGVSVLAQSSKVEEAEQIKGPDVAALLEFLRRNYDFVIVDGVRGFDELSLAALDGSQHVFMTLTQDVPAVRNGQRCLELFGRLQYDQGRIKLLLNRYAKASKITVEVVGETLGQPLTHTITNDFLLLIDAINRGVLLTEVAPRARITQDIEGLIPHLLPERAPRLRRQSLLGTLFGKKVADGTT
ncbi:MAG TPA: AAA family ATPase [Polyangia bacterium]|jgi:pilus assembly protein CpaE|nr:AAA family ATPase [Polyangia bacterium]